MTSRIKELALMLSSPFFSQEDNFDMKSGGGRTFSGNNAHSDSNSSVMLRTAAKPEATEVEIPDWTDGKVREMMDDYERECAAGRLTGAKATERKQLMLKEIAAHQGQLIKELEKIHSEQGERQDTATLLDLWKKKRTTWENEVNSLGEDCIGAKNPEGKTYSIEKWRDKFIDYCNQGLLPDSAATYIMNEIQRILDLEQAEIDRIQLEKDDYLALFPDKKDREDPSIKENIDKFDVVLTKLNESHHQNLKIKAEVDTQSDKGKCYKEIEVDARFNGWGNTLNNESTITPLLNQIADLMKDLPFLEVTVLGDFAGADVEENLLLTIKEDEGKYEIKDYDPGSASSEGGIEKRSSDVAMLRALVLKKLLVNLGASSGNIKAEVGEFNTEQRARIIIE